MTIKYSLSICGGNRYVEGDLLTFGYLMLYDTFPLLTNNKLMLNNLLIRRSPGPITNNWGGRRPTLRGGVGGRSPPRKWGGLGGRGGAPPEHFNFKVRVRYFVKLNWMKLKHFYVVQNHIGWSWSRMFPSLGALVNPSLMRSDENAWTTHEVQWKS